MATSHPQAYFDSEQVLASTPELDAGRLLDALPRGAGLRVSTVEGLGLVAARRVGDFTHVVAGLDGIVPVELSGWQADDGDFEDMRTGPVDLELPAYCAWYASARRPSSTHRFDAWGRVAARALAPHHDVPPLRSEELLTIVARELVSPQTLEGYFDAIGRLREATGAKRFDEAMTFALTNALHDAEDPLELLAVTFSIWAKAPNGTGHSLHDEVLAPAARPYRRDNDEIRSHLGPRRQAEWDEFTARHHKPRRFLRRLRSRAR